MSDANAQWFYAVGQEQKGPVSADHLRSLLASGAIGRDTLVWTSSMTEWTPLGRTEFVGGGSSSFVPPPSQASYAASAGYAASDAYLAAPPTPNFRQAISICFSKYATFAGRASRPEFWWFILFSFVLTQVLTFVEMAVGGPGILSGIAGLALFLPSLAVGARRLHDTDRSGWMQLISLIPLIGAIVLIVFFCQRGTEGANRFG